MRRIKIAEIALCIIITAVTLVSLVPAIARIQRNPADAKCQSNLKRWAEAMDLYVADNNGKYPTNRPRITGGFGNINASISLSPDEIDPATGEPKRFVYGITWVEALYPYLWSSAKKTGQSWKTFLVCPNCTVVTYPPSPTSWARVSYVYNATFTEYAQSLVKDQKNVVILREYPRLARSILRPMNPNARGNFATVPQYPFLSRTDYSIYVGDAYKLHADGSYILFADGHVNHFTIDYYPESEDVRWDPTTQQWYNYYYPNPATDTERMLNKTIAITP